MNDWKITTQIEGAKEQALSLSQQSVKAKSMVKPVALLTKETAFTCWKSQSS